MEDKDFYPNLFAKKWKCPMPLVKDIANDMEHIFWECARDFARFTLTKSSWYWLTEHIDDYGLIVQQDMQLKKWITWAEEGKGALLKNLTTTHDLISWLLIRYVNCIKNLFDPRYKNCIEPIKFINYDENEIYNLGH